MREEEEEAAAAESKWQVKKYCLLRRTLLTSTQKNPHRGCEIVGKEANPAVHVAAMESNRRRPLRPLRTGI